jgi:hypothetical protein
MNAPQKPPPADPALERMAAIFKKRCEDLAERITVGAMPFMHAVDTAYEAAQWSGLIGLIGDDVVQAIMAQTFMRARKQ